MDISTMIVDLLRGRDRPDEGPNEIDPYASKGAELVAAGQVLRDPEYIAYKREALANGEPVMSMEEFQAFKSKGTR